MKLDVCIARPLAAALCALAFTACSFNPFISNNHTTGSATGTAIGAGIGAGTVAVFGGSKTMMVVGGIGGGALGYFFTSLSYDAGAITQVGGDVYILGDYIGIYLPTDQVFEANTAELLPGATDILNSVVTVLQRKPDNNIMISGNTSGFDRPCRELRLSQKRAKVVAAYLWSSGIQQFQDRSDDTRKFNYVGYGDYFPIASDHTNNGIRKNSRIQITSYPPCAELRESGHKINMNKIASLDNDHPVDGITPTCGRGKGEC
jgi:outer membrane protein OmpA-like peptidoglycan-associated protein